MPKKVFDADLNNLHDMLFFIRTSCSTKKFPTEEINKIIVATEEAIVNIIHHGYKHNQGIIEIQCDDIHTKPGLRITIKDVGVPFNPMEKISFIKESHHTPTEDKSIGGYGIFLYVEIMDHVEYQRKGDFNVLSLIKYLPNPIN